MSLPQPPSSTTVYNPLQTLTSLSPSTEPIALPPPHFSPGAHLDREEAFALKRPGEELDTRLEPRAPKKPKHARRPSQQSPAAPAPFTLLAPPPAAAPAAEAPAPAPEAPPPDTPVRRFNLWLNAIRLPVKPPEDWQGNRSYWTATAYEELAWMKGDIVGGGSEVLGEAWNQLRATSESDENRIKTFVSKAINLRRTKAARGEALFPSVPSVGGQTTTRKDGKIVIDLTLEDTPEPEESSLPRPSTSADASQTPLAPPTRPSLPSHPSAPSSLKVTLKVRPPPQAPPNATDRPDSAPPTAPLIRPPAVRARIANPLQRASPMVGEAAQAKPAPSQPVVYGSEGFVLSPQLGASPFLAPPKPLIPSLSPPLLPPGQPASTASLQPPASPSLPPPAPAISLPTSTPQPPAATRRASTTTAPAILLPASSRERISSHEERGSPKPLNWVTGAREWAAEAAAKAYPRFSAAGVAEQPPKQRSAPTSDEYSPLRPALDLPPVEPLTTAPTTQSRPSLPPRPHSHHQSPTDAERGAFSARLPSGVEPSVLARTEQPRPSVQPPPRAQQQSTTNLEKGLVDQLPPFQAVEEARPYTIGQLVVPPAMPECYFTWSLQYGEAESSNYISRWGVEVGLKEHEIQKIVATLQAVYKTDNPAWAEMERRQRVSERHLQQVGRQRRLEEEARASAARRSLAAQQQQQQQPAAATITTHQQQQQRYQELRQHPRLVQAQTTALPPARRVPTVGDALNHYEHQYTATAAPDQLVLRQQQAQRDYDVQLSQTHRRASSGASPVVASSPTFALQAPRARRRASDGQSRSQGNSPNSNRFQLQPIHTSTNPPPSSSRPRTAERSAPPAQFGPSISPISPALSPHLPSTSIPSHQQFQQQQSSLVQAQPPVPPSPSPAELLFATLRPLFPAMQAFVTALDSGEIGKGGEELERKWNSRLKAVEQGQEGGEKGKEPLVGLGVQQQ
ncbi:hypothetical protein BCR35DRAFT_351653 [Leucosporidium creatinivorum]|uniref:Uncharacterized protein n=1 Tax=Leucosporidium creatinivorum TaxID=106004 RepID=A0A1Y2FNZ7_9BASI|nr:hypothetical protein BCR35DRAFT_351653 [Leucosporidium creatinivorum]